MESLLSEQEAYDELSYYTLSLHDPAFIHQHIVDAFAAQHAMPGSKPITVAFALIGLYLLVEKGYSGKQVQQTHMRLAEKRKEWPFFAIPEERGSMTVKDILKENPGQERDDAIYEWAASVWDAWKES